MGGAQGSRLADTGLFVREFLRNPTRVAAVAPSSAALAAQMVAPIPERGEPVVVELGPGTGAFTSAIQDRLRGRGVHIALELHPTMADVLTRRFPEVEVENANAVELPGVLARHGVDAADVIISGLPWAAYENAGSKSLVTVVAEALRPGGTYTQFAYGWTRWAPPAKRLLRQLRVGFEEVVISRTVWANVPPALVYLARRPRVRDNAAADDPRRSAHAVPR